MGTRTLEIAEVLYYLSGPSSGGLFADPPGHELFQPTPILYATNCSRFSLRRANMV